MFSITLKSKGKVTIDLYAVSVAEIRDMMNTKKKPREGDEILSKAVNLSADEIAALPYPDYRKLVKFFWQCANDPLKDEDDAKNSQSESISE